LFFEKKDKNKTLNGLIEYNKKRMITKLNSLIEYKEKKNKLVPIVNKRRSTPQKNIMKSGRERNKYDDDDSTEDFRYIGSIGFQIFR